MCTCVSAIARSNAVHRERKRYIQVRLMGKGGLRLEQNQHRQPHSGKEKKFVKEWLTVLRASDSESKFGSWVKVL